MRSLVTILLLSGILLPCRAQFMDTLHDVFSRHSSIDARLESRYSLIDNELIKVNGLRLGVAFQRKLRIGGGVSWLTSNVSKTVFGADTVRKNFKFVYLCYYIDFVFYKTKRWQLSVPIQAGTGYSWLQEGKTYSRYNKDPKYFMLLYEPGITVQFKVFKWMGLGSDIAYRFALNNSRRTQINLNSPTYSFKLLFWFDQLFYELAPQSKITQKYGPAYW